MVAVFQSRPNNLLCLNPHPLIGPVPPRRAVSKNAVCPLHRPNVFHNGYQLRVGDAFHRLHIAELPMVRPGTTLWGNHE